MKFSILASGSKANCTLVQAEDSYYLIDCGLSLRELTKRLKSFDIEPQDISGVLVTHEHDDHVHGLKMLTKRFGTDVFLTEEAYDVSPKLREISPHLLFFYQVEVPFRVGGLNFYSYELSHDASLTVGFRITSSEGKVLSYLTDLGCYDRDMIDLFGNCDGLILEANHDEEMLWTNSYPWQVKERISGRRGHLSNGQASEFLKGVLSKQFEKTPKIVAAAHLSENSNLKEHAIQALRSPWEEFGGEVPELYAADAFQASPYFSL